MKDATDILAEQLAAQVIAEREGKLKFNARRNRKAYNRMNRPHKLVAQDKGYTMMMNILAKAVPELAPVTLGDADVHTTD